jgi:ABC-type transporter lipoprotein component MlaA
VFFENNMLGPVAHGYSAVVPQGARNHISISSSTLMSR